MAYPEYRVDGYASILLIWATHEVIIRYSADRSRKISEGNVGTPGLVICDVVAADDTIRSCLPQIYIANRGKRHTSEPVKDAGYFVDLTLVVMNEEKFDLGHIHEMHIVIELWFSTCGNELELRINLMQPILVCTKRRGGIDSKRTLSNECSTYASVIDDLFKSVDFFSSSVHDHMNIANGSLAEALSDTIMLYVTHGSGWCLSGSHRRRQRITKLLASTRASQHLVLGGLRWACGHRWSRHAGHGWVALTQELGRRGKIVQIASICAQFFAFPESCHQILLLL